LGNRFGKQLQGGEQLWAKRHLNLQKWYENAEFYTFSFGHVFRATTACIFSTSKLPKVARTWGNLYIFTSKYASRLNGVYFSHIGTSKSGPNVVCIVQFYFEMYFATQRRVFFRHLNFYKLSDPSMFSTCLFRNLLRATTACTFSTS